MKIYPYGNVVTHDLVEIIDTHDTPFMLCPHHAAKGLPQRTVSLMLFDTHNKLLLWQPTEKRKETQSTWGLLHASVQAGEAREDTVERLLQQRLALPMPAPLYAVAGQHIGQTQRTFYHATLSTKEKLSFRKNILWLDMDELQGFAQFFSDMLTPDILHLIEQNALHSLRNCNMQERIEK